MSKDILYCYIRVSSDIQESKGSSLDVQKDMGIEVSKKLGMKVDVETYNEGSRSSTIHYREKLHKLQDDIKLKKVKNIWVQDRSRLFRDMVDGVTFRNDYLERFNVTLYEGSSPNKLEFNSEDERLIYDLITRIQQSENIKRSEKSQIGKLRKLKKESPNKPVFLGGTPLFGYETVDRLWSINKDESHWVKFIFTQYEKGLSSRDIKIKLDNEGINPRRTNSGLWNVGTLQNMLRNKSYTGLHSVNEYKVLNIDKITKKKTREVIHTYNYKIPKIIDVGQYNRVQKLLDLNIKTSSNNKQHFSLLDGLIFCDCGTKVGSKIQKWKPSLNLNPSKRYYCLSGEYKWKSNDVRCLNKMSLQMDKTNEYVLDSVKTIVSQSNILKEKFKSEVMGQKKNKEEDIKKETKFLENKIQSIQKIIDELENNIVDLEIEMTVGKRDKHLLQKIISKMETELQNQQQNYQDCESQIENMDKEKDWLNWVSKYGETLNLNTSNEKKQKEFIHGLIDKVIVHGDIGEYRNQVKQIGHTLEIFYKMNVVDDELIYKDEKNKKLGYVIKEGTNIQKSNTMKFVTSRKKKSHDLGVMLNCKLKTVSNSRVVSTYNLTNTECSTYNLTNKYITYVCFTVKHRTNSLVYYQNNKYSEEQEQTHNLIKSLHESGLGYRKISQILNQKNIKTSKGNTWKNTQVHSVLKRYRERQERLELMNRVYEPVWGKMYLKTVKRETMKEN